MRLRALIERLAVRPSAYLSAAFLLGVANVLAFAPFGGFWLPLVTLPLFFFLLENRTPRQAAWSGFMFGFGWFAVGTYWLYVSLHVFGKVPLLVAILLMLALAAIMALYYALFAWLLNRFWPAVGARRYLLAAPALWVLVEWTRGWFLSGFPWFAVGYSQVDAWLVGFAPLGGVFLVSLAVVLLAGAVRLACISKPVLRGLAALVTVIVIGGGAGLHGVEWTDAGSAIRIAMVQGNVRQDEKWLPENRQPTMQKYWRLTERVSADADLVIWPEAAIPALYNQLETGYFHQVENELLRPGQRLITGTLVHERERGIFFNSAVVLGGDEHRFYHKRHLVPFGEYFPVPGFVRNWLRLMNLPYSDFEPGTGSNALRVSDTLTVAMMICYEAVFGSEVADGAGNADLLVNISNDGWFGDSIGPKQHFQVSRMRAAETGRALVRVTNTGLSGVVAHTARPLMQLPANQPQAELVTVERRSGMTPFVRFGALVFLLPCMLLLGCAVALRWRELKA